jgi:hypothetical protein
MMAAQAAVAVVRATVAATNARIDAYLLEDGKAVIEGEGPHRSRSMTRGPPAHV